MAFSPYWPLHTQPPRTRFARRGSPCITHERPGKVATPVQEEYDKMHRAANRKAEILQNPGKRVKFCHPLPVIFPSARALHGHSFSFYYESSLIANGLHQVAILKADPRSVHRQGMVQVRRSMRIWTKILLTRHHRHRPHVWSSPDGPSRAASPSCDHS